MENCPLFNYFLQISAKPAHFKENLPQKDPCLETLGLKNPTYRRIIPVPSTSVPSKNTAKNSQQMQNCTTKSKNNGDFIPLLVAFQFFADFLCPFFISGKTLLFFSPMSVFSNQFDLSESCLFLVCFSMLRQDLQIVGLCL